MGNLLKSFAETGDVASTQVGDSNVAEVNNILDFYQQHRNTKNKTMILEITSELTGYTIQKVKGKDVNFFKSTPAIVLPTYKAKLKELGLTFDVTRDGWYSLGKIKNKNQYSMLNRAFEPQLSNIEYSTIIEKFPKDYEFDGIRLLESGSTFLVAKPLETQKHLDNTDIEDKRININRAGGIFIHIAGYYNTDFSWDWLATSYGCFGFIPKQNVKNTEEEAKTASEDDDYDDHMSDKEWNTIMEKINLAVLNKTSLKVVVKQRSQYLKSKIINESEILEE